MQEVGVAASVTTPKGVIGAPKIVNEDSLVIWQDIGGGKALDAAFRTITIKTVSGGARDMQPVGFTNATDAGFIAVKDGGLD